MAKKINPLVGILGGLMLVLLIFSIIAIILHPGPTVSLSHGAVDGDTVSVQYTGKLTDGTVFDSNMEEGRELLTFVVGSGAVIKGFDDAVHGMEAGDSKTVTIPPEDAYPYYEELVVTYTKSDVVDSLGSEPAVGDKLMTVSTVGTIMEGTVTEVTPTTIIIDYNSAVAGQTLVFDITVVEVVSASGH
ncbi:Trigger factor [Methanimicrococcus hongohii]|uniref:Peptidyl-prolyl cis-trans isomerase n=1 Tax=Methanimicrococcus hongohii TaxID=3028295 RepID=A0AA96UYW6_9EURY|nr:peptidylprolyl isomerase [Methanimicrococcus sp. Hf6]WNY23202.1 Trigger factor [Methanimicrococcus sp. Hf6]